MLALKVASSHLSGSCPVSSAVAGSFPQLPLSGSMHFPFMIRAKLLFIGFCQRFAEVSCGIVLLGDWFS